jgi:uncharacterized membrane protein YqjE
VTDPTSGKAGGRSAGLLTSSRRLAESLLALVQTRLEIVAGEFEEERERLRELVVYGLMSLLLVSFGIIFLTLLVVLLLWDDHRYAVLGTFAVIYLGGGGVAFILLQRKLGERSRLFAATIAELKKDRQSFTPEP